MSETSLCILRLRQRLLETSLIIWDWDWDWDFRNQSQILRLRLGLYVSGLITSYTMLSIWRSCVQWHSPVNWQYHQFQTLFQESVYTTVNQNVLRSQWYEKRRNFASQLVFFPQKRVWKIPLGNPPSGRYVKHCSLTASFPFYISCYQG